MQLFPIRVMLRPMGPGRSSQWQGRSSLWFKVPRHPLSSHGPAGRREFFAHVLEPLPKQPRLGAEAETASGASENSAIGPKSIQDTKQNDGEKYLSVLKNDRV